MEAAKAAAKASSSDIPALGLEGARRGLPGVDPLPACLLRAAAAAAVGCLGCSVLKGPEKKLEIFVCPLLPLPDDPALAAAAAAALLAGLEPA